MKFPHCSYIFFGITLSMLNLSINKRGETWPQGGETWPQGGETWPQGGAIATRGSHGYLAPSPAIPLGGEAYLKQMI